MDPIVSVLGIGDIFTPSDSYLDKKNINKNNVKTIIFKLNYIPKKKLSYFSYYFEFETKKLNSTNESIDIFISQIEFFLNILNVQKLNVIIKSM